jgi:zinc protease
LTWVHSNPENESFYSNQREENLRAKHWTAIFAGIALGYAVSTIAAVPNQADVADAIRLKVEKFTLPNGLTVLLHEDHSAPFFSYQQWFRVGSRHEKPGLTGLAHFFEHLMFKGTKKYPGDKLDRLIRANGGASNAFTTRDFTGYYMNLPSEKLELAVDLESDRMRNLTFDQKQIDSEREVVKEERRYRVDNEVSGTLEEKLWRTVYKVHPYHWPVIGSMVDLNRATMDDMKEFYRVYYAPNNAIVVLAGDFDAKAARKLIEKYYGKIPGQKIPAAPQVEEPPQLGERRAVIPRQVQNPSAIVAFRTVKSGDDDMYALDLAASVLGGGTSSRLYRRLVYNDQTVSGVSVSSYTPKEPGMFRVSLSLKPGQNPEPVLANVATEVYKLRTHPITDAELDKAKNLVMKDYVESLKTISGKANALAIHEMYSGDYQMMFKDLEKYLLVTKEQIMTAADRYLKPTTRNVVMVQPGTAQAMPEKEAEAGTAATTGTESAAPAETKTETQGETKSETKGEQR